MTQRELAERTGRPVKTINEIITGKAAITSETALQLERVLGTPASFWLNRERAYREHLARIKDAQRLAADVNVLGLVPVRDMIALGWIRAEKSKPSQVRAVLQFFGVATGKELGEVCLNPVADFRMSPSFKSAPGAIAAWLRKGELEAQKVYCEPYDQKSFEQQLGDIRTLTREPDRTMDVVKLAAKAGVAVVFLPRVGKVTASGAARWLSKDKSLIQLSLRYKSDDQVWFSFFHEAAHVLLHPKREVFVDMPRTDSDDYSREKEEREADGFASDFLIPPTELEGFYNECDYRRETAVRRFAERIGVSEGIVVGRMQHDKKVPWSHLNRLKGKFDWQCHQS
jgi:addiction module HigA family antidote